jgi:Tol biopolymer transport system component
MALSPDGSRIAFGARDAEGKTMLWVRALDSLEAHPLAGTAGTEGGRYPFWSPDNRSIGFFSATGLAMVPAAGGAVERISDAGVGRGATWSREGVVLLAAGFLNPITRVDLSDPDRKRVPVTKLDQGRGETGHTWPHFLPDGRHFLYLVQRVNPQTRRSEGEVYVQELGSNERKLLLRSVSRTLYAPSGHLLYWWEGNLMARPFDVRGLRLTGDAVLVAKGVQHLEDSNAGVFSLSETGLLAYAQGGPIGLSQLTIFDRSGKVLDTLGAAGNIWTPHLSRGGRWATAETIDPVSNNRDIAVFDLAGGGPATRATFDPGEDLTPVFSPDGSRVAFSSFRNGAWAIFEKTLGGPEERPIFPLPGAAFLTDWSPDGRFVAFNRASPETSDDIWLLSVAERKAEPFLRTPAQERDAVFSYDGKWVAYFSAESGRPEIYVRPFPEAGGKWQVSTSGGTQPRWRSDGKELYYVAPGGKLMAVPVKAATTFEAGIPRVLFQTLFRQTVIAQYDVFPGGQRFIVNNSVTAKSSSPITLVQNWREAAR